MMNASYILLNIVLPFVAGFVLMTLVLNVEKLAEIAIWAVSFKERKAYNTVMSLTPTLEREYETGEYTMYIYGFEGHETSATVIVNNKLNCVKLGIFDDSTNECIYGEWYCGDSKKCKYDCVCVEKKVKFLENKKKQLYEHLMNSKQKQQEYGMQLY